MVVEHIFITTLESNDAMKLASEVLSSRGFEIQSDSAFQLGQTAWTSLQVRRGKAKASRSKFITDLPQQVRLEWDRGRVVLAASIEPRASHFTSSSKKKAARQQSDMLVAIAKSVENALSLGMPIEQACAEWDLLEHEIVDKARRNRRTLIVALVVIFLLVAGLITLAVINS